MRTSKRRLLAGVVSLLASTSSVSARASAIAAYVREPAALGGSFTAKQTSLVVEHVEIVFWCGQTDCRFSAAYRVHNPGEATEEVLGAFFSIRADVTSIEADGIDARVTLSPEQRQGVLAAASALDANAGNMDVALERSGFTIAVGPSGRKRLTFAGRIRPVQIPSSARDGYFVPPLLERHPLLGSERSIEATTDYACALFPVRGWAGASLIDLAVHLPDNLRWGGRHGEWSVAHEAGEQVVRASIPAADAGMLGFGVVSPARVLTHGGPLVAVGPRLDVAELRIRAGYEVGFRTSWIASVAGETTLHRRYTLAPVVEAATPSFLLAAVPSFGLGAGIPMQVPGGGVPPVVGARGQLTASSTLLSLVFPIDWFPAARGRDALQAALYLQASF